MVEFITLFIAAYGAVLSTINWIDRKAKRLRINIRAENTVFENRITGKTLIFQIINLSTKSIFIKYAFLLNRQKNRILISPESFWGSGGELSVKEIHKLDPDRMFEIIYSREEATRLNAKTFIIENETGKQFSISFDIAKLKPATYTVSIKHKKIINMPWTTKKLGEKI